MTPHSIIIISSLLILGILGFIEPLIIKSIAEI